MTTVRDNFCTLAPVQIPRPKCQGFQWVQTRGRQGFYKSIRANGKEFGLAIKTTGPRRPALSQDLYRRPETVHEEEGEKEPTMRIRVTNGNSSDMDRSITSSQLSSDGSRRSSPDPEPDYPSDYVPPQLPPPRFSNPRLPPVPASRPIKF